MNNFTKKDFPPLLTNEETIMYFEHMNNGDVEAREKLILCNLKLVKYFAFRYGKSREQRKELIELGTIALINAVDNFDVKRNTTFCTYASKYIINQMFMFFRNNKKESLNVSLDEPISIDNEGQMLTLFDVYQSEEKIESEIYTKELIQAINQILSKLPDRERMIITWRLGLGCKKKNLSQISKRLKISRTYISRVEIRAKRKIAEYLSQKGFYTFRETPEMKEIKKMTISEKSVYFAKKILEEGFTITTLSLRCNESEEVIKKHLFGHLKNIDYGLMLEVKDLLDRQKQNNMDKLSEYFDKNITLEYKRT